MGHIIQFLLRQQSMVSCMKGAGQISLFGIQIALFRNSQKYLISLSSWETSFLLYRIVFFPQKF